MEEIRASVQERVRDVGVEIVDVRLKRIEFVPEINEDVFRRMQSERKRVATEQRSIGAAEARRSAPTPIASARCCSPRPTVMRRDQGEGDARASAVYAQAFGQNPEFFSFYRSLEAYRLSFRSRRRPAGGRSFVDFLKYFRTPVPARAPTR